MSDFYFQFFFGSHKDGFYDSDVKTKYIFTSYKVSQTKPIHIFHL